MVDQRERFALLLESMASRVPASQRLKRLLKHAKRVCLLKAVSVTPLPADPPAGLSVRPQDGPGALPPAPDPRRCGTGR
jgi:hypothetical protein